MRKRMNKRLDKKVFRTTAAKTKYINVAKPMRGGIRL